MYHEEEAAQEHSGLVELIFAQRTSQIYPFTSLALDSYGSCVFEMQYCCIPKDCAASYQLTQLAPPLPLLFSPHLPPSGMSVLHCVAQNNNAAIVESLFAVTLGMPDALFALTHCTHHSFLSPDPFQFAFSKHNHN